MAAGLKHMFNVKDFMFGNGEKKKTFLGEHQQGLKHMPALIVYGESQL